MFAIQVQKLTKSYADVQAVRGITFDVAAGEIFGLLGPNGAGKTTTMEIIEGLSQPDTGEVRVLGMDVRRDLPAIKQRIGVQLQSTALFPNLTVREQLELFASFYEHSLPAAEVLALVELEEKAEARASELSGGQRQRLAIGLALINQPSIVFLDEPTTGLDPQARLHTWELVRMLRARGTTMLITSHYMEEAERLCDRLCIIDHGEVIAAGTPRELISVTFKHSALRLPLPPIGPEPFKTLTCIAAVHVHDGEMTLHVHDTVESIAAVASLARKHNFGLQDLRVTKPTLEDLFLKLTGRPIRK